MAKAIVDNASPFAASVSAWAEIEGTKYPILSFESKFSMNAIPTASVYIAIGTLAAKSDKFPELPDNIRAIDVMDSIQYNKKVLVWGRFEGEYGPGGRVWPDEDVLLFAGYTNGVGFARNFNELAVTLSIVHWIIDLDRTSSATNMLAGQNSANILAPALIGLNGQAAIPQITSENGRGFVSNGSDPSTGESPYRPNPIRSELNVIQDIWKNGIKEIFIQVSQQSTLGGSTTVGSASKIPIYANALEDVELNNTVALRALRDGIDFDKVGKLVMDMDGEIDIQPLSSVHASIRLGEQFLAAVARQLHLVNNNSLWQTLVSMAGDFRYAIIPGVKTVTVAPQLTRMANYRQSDINPNYTISANEYSFSNLSPQGIDRVIGGVILFNPIGSATNGMSDNTGIRLGYEGIYPKPKDNRLPELREGHWHILPAPRWLNHDLFWEEITLDSLPGPAGQPAPNMQDPDSSKTPDPNSSGTPASQKQQEIRLVADEWAKTLYFEQKFEGRRGLITGKLRFDIGPGTQARVQVVDAKMSDKLIAETWIQGCVETVITNINAQARNASTTFVMKNYRTKKEDSDEPELPDVHPLYPSTNWTGSCLVKIPGVANI